ncbi:hypothetical protein Tco_0940323 [Tanacetum coccineum]|uniref:Uncharacterized protein n=1 Tax=Tanacetum coccineum TaxID=301880 RepID=A0ABQ5DPE2_9ASTR
MADNSISMAELIQAPRGIPRSYGALPPTEYLPDVAELLDDGQKALVYTKKNIGIIPEHTGYYENCSAVMTKDNFQEKLGDPGRFLIPCDFPELDECLALADLGIDDAECDLEKDIISRCYSKIVSLLSTTSKHAYYESPVVRKELQICEGKPDVLQLDRTPEILEMSGEKAALLKVLQSHKRAIAGKLLDIKGYFQIPIDPYDQEKDYVYLPLRIPLLAAACHLDCCNTPGKCPEMV